MSPGDVRVGGVELVEVAYDFHSLKQSSICQRKRESCATRSSEKGVRGRLVQRRVIVVRRENDDAESDDALRVRARRRDPCGACVGEKRDKRMRVDRSVRRPTSSADGS